MQGSSARLLALLALDLGSERLNLREHGPVVLHARLKGCGREILQASVMVSVLADLRRVLRVVFAPAHRKKTDRYVHYVYNMRMHTHSSLRLSHADCSRHAKDEESYVLY